MSRMNSSAMPHQGCAKEVIVPSFCLDSGNPRLKPLNGNAPGACSGELTHPVHPVHPVSDLERRLPRCIDVHDGTRS